MRKITLEDEYGTYSVETTQDPVTIDQIFEGLIIPVLLAAGFGEGTINDYLDVETPSPWESRRAKPGDEGYPEDDCMGI